MSEPMTQHAMYNEQVKVYEATVAATADQAWRIVWLEGVTLSYGALTLWLLAKGHWEDGAGWAAIPLSVIAVPMLVFGWRQLIRWVRHSLTSTKDKT